MPSFRDACNHFGWQGEGPIPWEAFAQGEYVGPARLQHVPVYRLRVDDRVDFVFRLTREASQEAYRLEVGDRIQIQLLKATELDQEVIIQPDGSISLRLLGQVLAAGRSIDELRIHLDEQFEGHVREPNVSVIPLVIDSRLDAIRDAVDNRFGRGGQAKATRVTPEGTIQLPAIGSIPVQGLTLDELKREVNLRYSRVVKGLGVTPILEERAPRYVFVVGEVANPGRFTLEGPTTVMQAIALAGSWNVGAHLQHVVVFRRDENWNLMATKLDIHGALFGKRPCPADEIWIRDSDIVLLPKSPLLHTDDMIDLIFTRGIYSVFPIRFNYNFSQVGGNNN